MIITITTHPQDEKLQNLQNSWLKNLWIPVFFTVQVYVIKIMSNALTGASTFSAVSICFLISSKPPSSANWKRKFMLASLPSLLTCPIFHSTHLCYYSTQLIIIWARTMMYGHPPSYVWLTLLLPWVTKTEFLLTISIQCQPDKWW